MTMDLRSAGGHDGTSWVSEWVYGMLRSDSWTANVTCQRGAAIVAGNYHCPIWCDRFFHRIGQISHNEKTAPLISTKHWGTPLYSKRSYPSERPSRRVAISHSTPSAETHRFLDYSKGLHSCILWNNVQHFLSKHLLVWKLLTEETPYLAVHIVVPDSVTCSAKLKPRGPQQKMSFSIYARERQATANKHHPRIQWIVLTSVQLNCIGCTLVPGPTTEVVYQTSPPTDTIAVIVDISPAGGAMKIGEKSDNDLGVTAVGKVGTEDVDALVIVPWNTDWWFYSIGSVGMQYVVRTWQFVLYSHYLASLGAEIKRYLICNWHR